MELISDDSVVEVKDGKVVVTRTMVESFDAEEYIRTLASMREKHRMMGEDRDSLQDMIDDLSSVEEEMIEMREKEIESTKEQVSKVSD